MTVTERCYRCGIDFDAAPFRPGSPCEDCQYEVHGEWRLDAYWQGKTNSCVKLVARESDIRYLRSRGLSAARAAERLSITRRRAERYYAQFSADSRPTEQEAYCECDECLLALADFPTDWSVGVSNPENQRNKYLAVRVLKGYGYSTERIAQLYDVKPVTIWRVANAR